MTQSFLISSTEIRISGKIGNTHSKIENTHSKIRNAEYSERKCMLRNAKYTILGSVGILEPVFPGVQEQLSTPAIHVAGEVGNYGGREIRPFQGLTNFQIPDLHLDVRGAVHCAMYLNPCLSPFLASARPACWCCWYWCPMPITMPG